MKATIYTIILFVFLVLITMVGWLSYDRIQDQKEISRLNSNFEQRGDSISFLSYNAQELRTEIAGKDARYRTADSLLKAKDLKISQLKHLRATEVVIYNTDTVTITNVDTLKIRELAGTTLVKTPFSDSRNCITVEGFVISTDSFPSVAITSQNAKIETYELQVKRKWWQFWKPRTWVETYTKCGNLRVLDVGKTK